MRTQAIYALATSSDRFLVVADGEHDGQRDDSIGLAYAVTHGYAGLRASGARMTLRTAALRSRGNIHIGSNGGDGGGDSGDSGDLDGRCWQRSVGVDL